MKYTRASLQQQIPPWYRWELHLIFIIAFCAIGIAGCLARLQGVRLSQWFFFVAALAFSNLGEYWLHRGPLHRPGIIQGAYERHIAHHAFFTYDAMGVDEMRDLRWVLFPVWAFPAILLTITPLVLALWTWTTPNLACLFLLAVLVYYTAYEFFHTMAHLPEEHWLAGRHIVRSLTHHHRVHHDPRLMRRYNFNFAVPLFDGLFGTMYQGTTPENESTTAGSISENEPPE